MKVGLLADIHANSLALEIVLQSAEVLGVEQLLIAGDLVGYYFSPLDVCRMLEDWPTQMVRGNHEDYLRRARKDSQVLAEFNKTYGYGLKDALDQLDATQLDKLTSLPHPLAIEIDGLSILLCHGAPWDNDCYIYPDASDELLGKCLSGNHDVVVLGHTHYPMLRKIGETTIVNPGSVGQPRNRKPGAHWAVLDTINGEIEFRNELYDPAVLVAQCLERNADLPYLSEVLTRT